MFSNCTTFKITNSKYITFQRQSPSFQLISQVPSLGQYWNFQSRMWDILYVNCPWLFWRVNVKTYKEGKKIKRHNQYKLWLDHAGAKKQVKNTLGNNWGNSNMDKYIRWYYEIAANLLWWDNGIVVLEEHNLTLKMHSEVFRSDMS